MSDEHLVCSELKAYVWYAWSYLMILIYPRHPKWTTTPLPWTTMASRCYHHLPQPSRTVLHGLLSHTSALHLGTSLFAFVIWQHHPSVGDDAGQSILCPPTENITKDPFRVTVSDEEPIHTTNDSCLIGTKESVRLLRPQIPQTSRRRERYANHKVEVEYMFDYLSNWVWNWECRMNLANLRGQTVNGIQLIGGCMALVHFQPKWM